MKPAIGSLSLFPTGPIDGAAPGIALRPYQDAVIKKLRSHISHGKKRLLLVAPCASGKMVMIAAMIRSSTVPCMFVVHRRELIDQLVRELAKYDITYVSVIRGDDDRFDPSATIHLASIQSLMRRDKPKVGLIFCDEAHRSLSDSYSEHIFEAYPDAIIIGATATPTRLDGQPMGDRYEAMEIATTYSELLRLKHLIEPDVFGAPVQADLSGVRINHGDYNEAELGQVMSQQHLRGQLVRHWIERAHLHKTESGKWEPGPLRRTLVFAATVEHSKAICGDFARMGVRVAHLDGTTPNDDRQSMLLKLDAGELDIISNVNCLLEGVDIPSIKCIVHARPTQSLVLWIQSTARALRLWNGIRPLILDHAGNCERHYLPHNDWIWLLDKKANRHPGQEPTKLCPSCNAYVALGRYSCPYCGHEFPETTRQLPKETNETLIELTPAALQRAFYDEQVTKARTKGFKPGYPSAKFKEKFGHWPPYGWSESTKSSFASDAAWQQALSQREGTRTYWNDIRASGPAVPGDVGPATPSGQVQTVSDPDAATSARTSDAAADGRPAAASAAEVYSNPMPPCTVCGGDGSPNFYGNNDACTHCAGSGIEPDNDYLSDPDDAPFAAWLDEQRLER